MNTALHTLEELASMANKTREERIARLALAQLARPSSIRKPRVFKDGNQWCALEGENIQEGVCGFGNTPDAACREFDSNWMNERPNALVRGASDEPTTK